MLQCVCRQQVQVMPVKGGPGVRRAIPCSQRSQGWGGGEGISWLRYDSLTLVLYRSKTVLAVAMAENNALKIRNGMPWIESPGCLLMLLVMLLLLILDEE